MSATATGKCTNWQNDDQCCQYDSEHIMYCMLWVHKFLLHSSIYAYRSSIFTDGRPRNYLCPKNNHGLWPVRRIGQMVHCNLIILMFYIEMTPKELEKFGIEVSLFRNSFHQRIHWRSLSITSVPMQSKMTANLLHYKVSLILLSAAV